MFDKICDNPRRSCTGCGACSFVCPKKCIDMVPDAEGFSFPVIDADTCVSCGRCSSVCPNNSMAKRNDEQHRAWAFQGHGTVALDSSSGGAFYALAVNAIKSGGIVYGAAFVDGGVRMRGVSDISALDALRGSKYVQGSIRKALADILKDAASGRPVLVCGTACQIAAISGLLPARNRESVLLVDLICHGVPSPALFKVHCRWVQNKHGGVLEKVEFRDKRHSHWLSSKHFCYQFTDGGIEHGNWKADPYYNAYLKGQIMRECCYSCRYATTDRCSDITIGDYWGLKDPVGAFDLRSGVSAVIAHTEKGVRAVETLSDAGVLRETAIVDVIEGNPNLCTPTKRPVARDSVYRDIERYGYDGWARRQVGTKDRVGAWVAGRLPLWSIAWVVKAREALKGRA